MITGKHLIEMGFAPSKLFKQVLDYANSTGASEADIRLYMESIQPRHIEPHSTPVNFHKNIVPMSAEEVQNVEAVVRDMSSLMTVPTVVNGAIMPDACPTGAGQIPVGGVVVAKNAIHPSMHSSDICCSVMATEFGDVDPAIILNAAHSITHFGPGRRKHDLQFELPQDLQDEIVANRFLGPNSLEIAKSHLGTQGDGNHFLFVGRSKTYGTTYMVTHHGSRGLGAYLYKQGMLVAEKFRKEISPKTNPKNAWIPYDTVEGHQYWEALQIVRKWTKLNHQVIHWATATTASAYSVSNFWNEHNFVFKFDDLFYHAKGATPLTDEFVPDNWSGLRLIPLNMSQPVLVVKGEATANNLGFAPHGAGRNVSRAQHKNNNSDKTTEQMFNEETSGLDVRFFSGRIDISELPSAYKNAETVKSQITEFGLGTVVDEIMPYGCIMAGHFDSPWLNKNK